MSALSGFIWLVLWQARRREIRSVLSRAALTDNCLGITSIARANSATASCSRDPIVMAKFSRKIDTAVSQAPAPGTMDLLSRTRLITYNGKVTVKFYEKWKVLSCYKQTNLKRIVQRSLHLINVEIISTTKDDTGGRPDLGVVDENELIIADTFLDNFTSLSKKLIRCKCKVLLHVLNKIKRKLNESS